MKRFTGTASFRDPIHGFIHADPLEQALINSQPLQRLRWIRQLAFAYLVFPGAEHSRFSHALGAMELAGKAYDALAAHGQTACSTPEPALSTGAACASPPWCTTSVTRRSATRPRTSSRAASTTRR